MSPKFCSATFGQTTALAMSCPKLVDHSGGTFIKNAWGCD